MDALFDPFLAADNPVLDSRASPAARALLLLCHLDAELEALRLLELALGRRLEALEVERALDRVRRRIESLCERRRALAIPPDLLRLYETSASCALPPRVVAVEHGACSACGADAIPTPADGGLRPCPRCGRVLYWRHAD